MAKFIRVYLSESDYDLLEKTAKALNKGKCTLAREIITNGLKQELKDTQLLNKLIQKIENLSSRSETSLQSEQQLNELKVLILILYVLTRNFASRMLFEAQKKELLEMVNSMEREKLGMTVYEYFGLK